MPARIVAAVVLAPPVLLAFYLGSPIVDLLVIAVVAVAAWEWVRLCQGGRLDRSGWLAVGLGPTVAALARYSDPAAAAILAAVGAIAVVVMGRLARPEDSRHVLLLTLAGPLYICAAGLSVLWIRDTAGGDGLTLVLWLVITVWATDIFAYLVGRSLGGPKLAPRISPGKTWSGLAGGVLAAAVVGLAFAQIVAPASGTFGTWALPAAVGAALALIAQAGDLMESGLKRRFGAKDSGGLIPGHGGMLDRIDGLVPAAIAVAILIWLGGAPF